MADFDVELPDRRIRARWVNRNASSSRPVLVFLHEGLGCIEMWRDFPALLCAHAGFAGFIYDRTGYGGSSPWPRDPGPHYMEIEADEVLPRLLAAAGIGNCILVGHSDGGTIALNHAALDPPALRAVVTIAAHAVNEPVCLESIRNARTAFESGGLRSRLAKYHAANVDGAFRLWSDAWLSPGFQPMDADARLPRVEVPVQAIQGEDDEYGTELQLGIIAGKVSGYCETRLIADCGHSPHLQQPDRVVAEIARFIAPLTLDT
jgi:pimeloyl-ACP methyl ester carboxylesterase